MRYDQIIRELLYNSFELSIIESIGPDCFLWGRAAGSNTINADVWEILQ
jgi:hypothetical protein